MKEGISDQLSAWHGEDKAVEGVISSQWQMWRSGEEKSTRQSDSYQPISEGEGMRGISENLA